MTTRHPKTMKNEGFKPPKNEGFKPPRYGLEALKMKVVGSHGILDFKIVVHQKPE